MTKKKSNRQKHQKDVGDTSEEELTKFSYQGKCCSHVSRGVNFGRVKKVLKIGSISTCSGCANSPPEENEALEVWLCLQCGYRGCGRLSTHKHGLQHFKTIHSDCHDLVLSPSSGMVWCYECDDEVRLQSSSSLKQCVEFIMKLKGNNNVKTENVKTSDEKKKPSSTQQSLLETVLKEETCIKNTASETVQKKIEPRADDKCKKDVSAKVPVKGLRNLGNTCYFNAVMQSLSQTSLLLHMLEESCLTDYKWEVPRLVIVDDSIVEDINADTIKMTLTRELQLVNNFLQFLKKMTTHQNKVDVINPNDLFSDLQRKSPQFQPYLQQDSHELLRQFLDNIRQDEVKRQKRAILKYFNIGNVNSEIDDDVRKLIKAYGCYASHTIIEKIFGGLLISTVLCEECKMSSQVFEPFMDMSLPLFEEKHQDSYDQLCPLLDGGKQEPMEPLRNRKTDQDVGDDNEYVLNKSKEDFGKPSKHQEKKMRQQEKKVKKKIRKVLNKKEVVEGDAIAVENEELHIPIDKETSEKNAYHSDSGIEKLNKHDHSGGDEQALEVATEVHNQLNESKQQAKGDLANTGNDEESVEEDFQIEPMFNDICVDTRLRNICPMSKEIMPKENGKDEFLVLFDEVVFLNDESAEVSSHPVEDKTKIVLPDRDSTLNNGEDVECNTLLDTVVADLVNEPDEKANISSMNSSELDERMHALSMQVKEIRIRKDSDRQESILSSSSRTDDCESPKSNIGSDDSCDDTACNVREDNWSQNLSESQTKDWILKSLTTLQPRKQVSPLECSVDTCLTHFTKPELLTGNNKFRCENCSEIKRKKTGDKKAVTYSNASKQLLVFSPPSILTLHLKRFQQVGMSLRKVNRFVEFPLTLDLAPYCSSACLILPHMSSVKDEILYSLYGIVEHSGRLTSGHYTAYVKVSKRTLNRAFINHLPLAQCDLEQLLHKFSSKFNISVDAKPKEATTSDERQWYYISDCHVREASEAQVLKCQAYLLFYERIK